MAARIGELAAVARHFNGTLSIHSGSGQPAEVLRLIGEATGGRWNYKISGAMQEELDELPAGLEEAERRNADYIVWLARQLRG